MRSARDDSDCEQLPLLLQACCAPPTPLQQQRLLHYACLRKPSLFCVLPHSSLQHRHYYYIFSSHNKTNATIKLRERKKKKKKSIRYLLTCSFFFGCQIHQALLPSPGSRFLFSAHPTDDTTVLLPSDTNNTFPSSSFLNQLSMLSLQYSTHDIPSPIYKNLPAFLLHELCNFPLLPPVETTDKRIASHA